MRSLTIAAGLAAAALVSSAPVAADVDPKKLVLRQTDVPAGFRLEARTSLYLPNSRFTRGRPWARNLVARSGRLTGYLGVYRKPVGDRVRYIASGVDLCRRPGGARILLRWTDWEERDDNKNRVKHGQAPYGRERAGVGAESWVYLEGPPAYSVRVVWRQGRVMAAIHSWGIGRKRTLALARVQQRLIASALR